MQEEVQASDTPLGICKCGMPKMNRIMEMTNGTTRKQKFCPRCDTKPDGEASGLVNEIRNVSDDEFKPVKNEKGFIEQVPVDDPRPRATSAEIKAAQELLAKEKGKPRPEAARPVSSLVAPEGIVAAAPPSTTGLLTISAELLKAWLDSYEETSSLKVQLESQELEDLYEFTMQLEAPKDMRQARALIKLQDRIDNLLGRSE